MTSCRHEWLVAKAYPVFDRMPRRFYTVDLKCSRCNQQKQTRQAGRPVHIFICGMPGSGNSLASVHCRRSGHLTHVLHADGEHIARTLRTADFILVTERRDECARVGSCRRRGISFGHKTSYTIQARRIFDALVEDPQKPTARLVYEDMQLTRGEVLNARLRDWGLWAAEWPSEQTGCIVSGRVLSEVERAEHRANEKKARKI